MFTVTRSSRIKFSTRRRCTRQNQHFSMTNAFIICAFMCLFTNAMAAQEPFVLTGSCAFTQNNGVCQGPPLTPPEGRDVVIEFATALCDVNANGQPTVYLKLIAESPGGKKTVYHLAPSNITERPQSTRTDTTFTHETRIYLRKSSKLTYEFQIISSGVGGQCDLTLQGK
jgi:hypothetical protein